RYDPMVAVRGDDAIRKLNRYTLVNLSGDRAHVERQWSRRVSKRVRLVRDTPDEEGAIIEAIQNARARARGQGFSVSPEVRRAVERHAMQRAARHFRAEGFHVEELGKPYDLHCTRGHEVLYVEVKGTTTNGEEVLLTPNEVDFARQNAARMVLFVC